MFEKEGFEWTEKNISLGISMYNPSIEMYCGKAFQDGAEFGYNKANEWHYVKDGLPKESKKYYVYSEEWGVEVRKFIADAGCFECRKNIIIAWKEIVLPNESE